MKRSLGYAAAISLMACAAHAQDTYSFVFGGATFSSDLDAAGIIGGAPQTVDTDLDTGFQLGIGVGKTLPRLSSDTIAVRGEVELSYSDADADEIFFSGNGPAAEINVGGDVQTTALFGNLYADFASSGAISPYVGAGVGIGRVSQDLIYGPGVRVSDSDTAFGAQLIAGVAWETSETLTWTADVRYRRFFDVESGRFAPTGASTGEISGDLDSVSLNIGARFSF